MEKGNDHNNDNPALAQVRRTERKVAVPTAVLSPSEAKNSSNKIVSVFFFIAIAGMLLSIGGGITAMVASVNSKNKLTGQDETLAKAKQAESYIPEITKEQEEFAKKAGNESTLDMFQKTNSGKVRMEADPDAGLNISQEPGKESGKGRDYDSYSDGDDPSSAEDMSGLLASAKTPFGGTAYENSNGQGEKPKLKPMFESFANNSFRPMRSPGQKMAASGKNYKGQNGQGGINSKNQFASKYMNSFKQPNSAAGGKLYASAKSTKAASKIPASKIGSRSGKNTMQQAKAMNGMIRSAVTAANFSTARAEMDVAWEGTTGDSEAENIIETNGLEEGQGMVVNPLGGKEKQKGSGYKDPKQNMPAMPDISDMIDVTPWKKELDAIRYMFLGAMALLGVAAAIADTQYGKPIAIGMAATATAACAAGVGLAITIMTKYGQSALGGMWLGICGAGVAACAVACIAGIAAYKGAETGLMGFLAAHVKAILLILGIVGGIGGGIGFGQDTDKVDKDKAKQYCKDHPDNSSCKDQMEEYKKKYNISFLPFSVDVFAKDTGKNA